MLSALVCCPFAWSAAWAQTTTNESGIFLGSRRELFVDRLLIDRLTNAHLHLHEPRDEGPVLRFDNSWEGPHAGYVTILKALC